MFPADYGVPGPDAFPLPSPLGRNFNNKSAIQYTADAAEKEQEKMECRSARTIADGTAFPFPFPFILFSCNVFYPRQDT